MSAVFQLHAGPGAGTGGGREGVGPGDQGRSTGAVGDLVAGPGAAVNTRSPGTRREPRLALKSLGAPQGRAARIPRGAGLRAPQGFQNRPPAQRSCPRPMLRAVSVSPGPDLDMESTPLLFPSWVFTIPTRSPAPPAQDAAFQGESVEGSALPKTVPQAGGLARQPGTSRLRPSRRCAAHAGIGKPCRGLLKRNLTQRCF